MIIPITNVKFQLRSLFLVQKPYWDDLRSKFLVREHSFCVTFEIDP